jgi:hypothetical protein
MQVTAAGMDSPPESRDCVGMPPDPFDTYKDDIEIIINTYTNKEIIQELFIKGLQTSLASLKRHLQIWGFRRQSGVRRVNTGASETLISTINDLYHRTFLNNAQITARLLKEGLQITGRQVKTIRLKSGWQRYSGGAQRAARTV